MQLGRFHSSPFFDQDWSLQCARFSSLPDSGKVMLENQQFFLHAFSQSGRQMEGPDADLLDSPKKMLECTLVTHNEGWKPMAIPMPVQLWEVASADAFVMTDARLRAGWARCRLE